MLLIHKHRLESLLLNQLFLGHVTKLNDVTSTCIVSNWRNAPHDILVGRSVYSKTCTRKTRTNVEMAVLVDKDLALILGRYATLLSRDHRTLVQWIVIAVPSTTVHARVERQGVNLLEREASNLFRYKASKQSNDQRSGLELA